VLQGDVSHLSDDTLRPVKGGCIWQLSEANKVLLVLIRNEAAGQRLEKDARHV
jgi:urease beta subunit